MTRREDAISLQQQLRPRLARVQREIWQWLFPPCCLLCGAVGKGRLDLCASCIDQLPFIRHACQRCGLPLASTVAGLVCGQCLRRPPPQAHSISLFEYREPVAGMITRLKFHADLKLARSLGELLLQRVRHEAGDVDLLLPVPLHPARLRQRGFNQSVELARPLVRGLGIAMQPALVRRVRNTPAQSSMHADARRRNLRSAFEVVRPPVSGHVVIIDDVVTTGSTVAELTRCLQRAGADRVSVWSLARALPK